MLSRSNPKAGVFIRWSLPEFVDAVILDNVSPKVELHKASNQEVGYVQGAVQVQGRGTY
jgi:hypothetical protein